MTAFTSTSPRCGTLHPIITRQSRTAFHTFCTLDRGALDDTTPLWREFNQSHSFIVRIKLSNGEPSRLQPINHCRDRSGRWIDLGSKNIYTLTAVSQQNLKNTKVCWFSLKRKRGRSPLVSNSHPSGGDFQSIDTTTRLSLSMIASPQRARFRFAWPDHCSSTTSIRMEGRLATIRIRFVHAQISMCRTLR